MSLELIGYASVLSAAPGESIRFMVSTDLSRYKADIVRLIHGDNNPAGPGFKEQVLETPISGEYVGRKQTACPGSYVQVPDAPALRVTSFTVQAWVYPTTPGNGKAVGIVSKWSPDTGGFGLFLNEEGEPELRVGGGDGSDAGVLETGAALAAREWCFVAASFDAATKRACLYQLPVTKGLDESESVVVENALAATGALESDAPLLIGAGYLEAVTDGRKPARGVFNGKIDRPRIFARVLSLEETQALSRDVPPQEVDAEQLVAAWDFAQEIATSRVVDTSRHALHGKAMQMPMRAVTDHTWRGEVYDYRFAPQEYGAIHFHDDDLEDAGWSADFEWSVPDGIQSGTYAARLRGEGAEDYIPFVVRPAPGKATAPILYLLPTNTYLAYGNDRSESSDEIVSGVGDRAELTDRYDWYLKEHREFAMSIYDRHSDGSGCCYSSRLRPIANMRPQYRFWLVNAPRHFPADLYVVDWMEQKGFAYDVVIDEDLDREGLDLLGQYKVVITGTHPEYWTAKMRDATEAFLANGGRMMYLGGNGFYWVTGFDAERPHVVEVRRGNAGTRAWNSEPGECYNSTTGELGGLWLHRGKTPNQLAGVGFTAMGWDGHSPGYVRKEESFDPRAAFIFEGVGDDEVIGDFGLVMNGAAGDELDRLDYDLGTPRQALLLASSEGHSDLFQPVIEDFLQITGSMEQLGKAKIHADMVYFETPGGGAVFSVGSIGWCGSLSHNGYENNVSRITENVLKKFAE